MVWSFADKVDWGTGDATPGNIDTNTTPFTADEKATILAAMQAGYDQSATARTMFENWITAGHRITVSKISNNFYAYANSGRIYLDLEFIKELDYIDDHGNAVRHTATGAILHELSHALTGKIDNYNIAADYYMGDNVAYVNQIFADLGQPREVSYIAQAWDIDASPLPAPGNNLLRTGYAYTGGAAIKGAIVSDRLITSTGGTNDLLIGGPGANNMWGGAGNDFLVGAGGDDNLNGGDGTDTAVYFDANPANYDIRRNDDGTWTVRHARGDGLDASKSDGTDTLTSIEKLLIDGKSYNLARNGLTFETDFALVIDTTGSMGSSIDSVKAAGSSLIDALFRDGKTDARIGIVGFKDTTNGEPSSVILPFTEQDSFADRKAAALSALNGIYVGGGGDIPETDYDGLRLALSGAMGAWRVGAAVHRIALFTDAPVKDTYLAAQVQAMAANIGAIITGPGLHLAGAAGRLDTFTLAPSPAGPLGIVLPGDPNASPLPDFAPGDSGAPGDTSGTQVQIFTIYTGSGSPSATGLADIAAGSGGTFMTAPSNEELVAQLMTIIQLPQINGLTTALSVRDYASLHPFSTVEIVDPASPSTVTATITLSAAANGKLFNLGAGSYDAGTGIYTVSGSAEAVTSALRGLIFTPTLRQAAPGASTDTSFTVKIDSSAGGSATNSATAAALSTGHQRASHDFDGSATSDVLFRNSDSGALLDWRVLGGAWSGDTVIAGANHDWVYAGGGDFNGDGTGDILFRNSDSGAVLSWQMADGAYAGAAVIAGANHDWALVGTGDFNGDGTSDILFENTATGYVLAWQMNAGAYGGDLVFGNTAAGQHILATGDFNGDGTTDILLRDSASGALTGWQIADGARAEIVAITTPGAAMTFVATGDFNGDGTTDLLFRDTETNTLHSLQMAAGHLEADIAIGIATSDWQFAGTGDMNGDGTTDILFQNSGSGAVLAWQMAGGHHASDALLAAASSDWKLLAA